MQAISPPNLDNSVILVPVYRYLEPETDSSLRHLASKGWTVIRRYDGSAIDVARSMMATDAILAGAEWLFWIDSDIHFDYTDFSQLVLSEGLFVAAPYMRKSPGASLAVLSDGERERAVGFGFVKTHRDIYLAQDIGICTQTPDGSHLIPYFYPDTFDMPWGRAYYAEDYSFCLRSEMAGHPVRINHDIKIGHIGRYSYQYERDGSAPVPTAELELHMGRGVVRRSGGKEAHSRDCLCPLCDEP